MSGDAPKCGEAKYCPQAILLAPGKTNVNCTRVNENTIMCSNEPQMVLGPQTPLVMAWPYEPEALALKTEPREDLTGPTPYPQVERLENRLKYNNPLILNAELQVDPPKKPVEIRLPECKRSIRLPQRPWKQCVENSLINDQVRRPLARWCHKRPLPPLVLPCHQIESLKLKITESERMAAEREARIAQREFEQRRSHCRHSIWNYTTESLLERKRLKQEEKERQEVESTKQLMKDVHNEKERQSEEQLARANKLILYRKGLIRDFHAALAYSKMMQEIEKSKESVTNSKDDTTNKGNAPFLDKRCMKRMLYENYRPDYTKKAEEKRPVAPNLLVTLRDVESRQKEHAREIDRELDCIKHLSTQLSVEGNGIGKSKYTTKPEVCDNETKLRRQNKLKQEFVEEIQKKLDADAFIGAHENEIDRQACEFNKYKRNVDAIRKAKELKLIEDKVAYNIMMSEKAAAVLVEMTKKKRQAANDYDALKAQWEAEWEDKYGQRGSTRTKLMELVYADFEKRKCWEESKRKLTDGSLQYFRQSLVAEDDYYRECEIKGERRKLALDIVECNKRLAEERRCREEKAKYMDDVWGTKMKQEYEKEMCEMKAYAQDCIQDWSFKGRTTIPMVHAMKKWDYDAGMYPFPPVNIDPKQAQAEDKEKDGREANYPDYTTTGTRLGFSCGGT